MEQLSKVPGISKILLADNEAYKGFLPGGDLPDHTAHYVFCFVIYIPVNHVWCVNKLGNDLTEDRVY